MFQHTNVVKSTNFFSMEDRIVDDIGELHFIKILFSKTLKKYSLTYVIFYKH